MYSLDVAHSTNFLAAASFLEDSGTASAQDHSQFDPFGQPDLGADDAKGSDPHARADLGAVLDHGGGVNVSHRPSVPSWQ